MGQRFLSHFAGLPQSQLGMTVQGCWQAPGSEQERQCDRPDALANEPGAQQLHTLLLLAPMMALDAPGGHGKHADASKEPLFGL